MIANIFESNAAHGPSGSTHDPDQTLAPLKYGAVLAAVQSDPGLTPKVKANVAAAVKRAASLVSKSGLAAPVDIPQLAKALDRLTPATLGFASSASLSAFKSNLRRGLSLAGVAVMPGRHRSPLRPDWAHLIARLPEPSRKALSRLAHVASSQGWSPAAIGPTEFTTFKTIIDKTCIKSKRNRLVRESVRVWRNAQQKVLGWPAQSLEERCRRLHSYRLDWSQFPASFKAEVDAFVDRAPLDDPFGSDDERRPIRPRTAQNYRDGLLRAASILVITGTAPSSITSTRDLLAKQEVLTIYRFLQARTGKERGGHVGWMIHLLLQVARTSSGVDNATKQHLERAWQRTRPQQPGMAQKSFARLRQFDDERCLDALLALPARILERFISGPADARPNARTIRSALLLSLLVDTAFRSKNVCQLDLDRHFLQLDFCRRAPRAIIQIPGAEVKNGQPLSAELGVVTIRLLDVWLHHFRPTITPVPSTWLFPKRDGGCMGGSQVGEDISDLASKEAGLQVHPHLIRAIAGKILLDAHPGAYPEVQTLLGHRSIQTTVQFYTPVQEEQVRKRYQDATRRRRQSGRA